MMESERISSQPFGTTSSGETVTKFTLKNKHGLQVDIIDYGGIIVAVSAPDKCGQFEDVTTGFNTVKEYEENPPYFGALIGRVAGRIHKGAFTLNGKDYKLAVNNGPNHLHGGINGYNKKIWKGSMEGDKLALTLVSPDGDENYPGEVKVTVFYSVNDDNELYIEYSATSSQATPINLTNHAYFNLAGHKAANVYDHTLQVFADKYTPKNDDDVPTGELADVAGTLLDFREPVILGSRVNEIPGDKPGVDHNFCLSGSGDKKLAARVVHAASGRVMEVYTDQPGIQIYTGNWVEGPGKDGVAYNMHCCLALETQKYPDSVHQPTFPSCILNPGETYVHKTWYKFSVQV